MDPLAGTNIVYMAETCKFGEHSSFMLTFILPIFNLNATVINMNMLYF